MMRTGSFCPFVRALVVLVSTVWLVGACIQCGSHERVLAWRNSLEKSWENTSDAALFCKYVLQPQLASACRKINNSLTAVSKDVRIDNHFF